MPRFARQRFISWYQRRGHRGDGSRGEVLLWPDTFTNNFHPEVGKAAVAVLEDAGFRVVLPDKTLCCGLTWISTGQLGMARRVLSRTMAALAAHVQAGGLVVGLEPSCAAVFRSDARRAAPSRPRRRPAGAADQDARRAVPVQTDGRAPPHVGGDGRSPRCTATSTPSSASTPTPELLRRAWIVAMLGERVLRPRRQLRLRARPLRRLGPRRAARAAAALWAGPGWTPTCWPTGSAAGPRWSNSPGGDLGTWPRSSPTPCLAATGPPAGAPGARSGSGTPTGTAPPTTAGRRDGLRAPGPRGRLPHPAAGSGSRRDVRVGCDNHRGGAGPGR